MHCVVGHGAGILDTLGSYSGGAALCGPAANRMMRPKRLKRGADLARQTVARATLATPAAFARETAALAANAVGTATNDANSNDR
jgi:hypothetical protein